MSLIDMLSGHTPKDNDEKKTFTGDSVFEIVEAKIIKSKKTGIEYIIVDFSATHPVAPKGDKVCNIVYGDRLSKVYDTTDQKKVEAFANDMFTAGVTIDSTDDETLAASLEAAKNTLVYFRCWEASFIDKETGEKVEYNKLLIKNPKLITEEMKTPTVPF